MNFIVMCRPIHFLFNERDYLIMDYCAPVVLLIQATGTDNLLVDMARGILSKLLIAVLLGLAQGAKDHPGESFTSCLSLPRSVH